MAHLGVIHTLCENAVPIDLVVAASYGSIVGAYFARGYSPERMNRMGREFRISSVLNRKTPWRSLFDGEKLAAVLHKDLGEVRIEELEIPLAILALDMARGDAVIFDKGPLVAALRASTAFPGLFSPFFHEGGCYVDGRMLWEILIGTARNKGADIVVFSDVSLISRIKVHRCYHRLRPTFAGLSRKRIPRGRPPAVARSKCRPFRGSVFPLLLLPKFLRNVAEVRNSHLGFPGVKADVTLSPIAGEIKPLRFRQVDRAIELGRAAALEAVPVIRTLLKTRGGGP
jgi:predicted acylesterase/phospholipase RssA